MVFQIAPERKVHGHLLVSVHVLARADVGGLPGAPFAASTEQAWNQQQAAGSLVGHTAALYLMQASPEHGPTSQWRNCLTPLTAAPHSHKTRTNDPSLYAILNILYSYSPYSSSQTIFQPQYPFLLALANHCISLLNSSFTDLSLV